MSVIMRPSGVDREKLTFCLFIRLINVAIGSLFLIAPLIFVIPVSAMTTVHEYVH